MGMVDFSAATATNKIVALPTILPFSPEFNWSAILSFVVIFLVSATETIGDTSALAATGLKRQPTTKELSGAIACDGLEVPWPVCLAAPPSLRSARMLVLWP